MNDSLTLPASPDLSNFVVFVTKNKKTDSVMSLFFVLHFQLRHQVVVRLLIFPLQVFHEAAAFTDFFDETASR